MTVINRDHLRIQKRTGSFPAFTGEYTFKERQSSSLAYPGPGGSVNLLQFQYSVLSRVPGVRNLSSLTVRTGLAGSVEGNQSLVRWRSGSLSVASALAISAFRLAAQRIGYYERKRITN